MPLLKKVQINPIDPSLFRQVLDEDAWQEFRKTLARGTQLFRGRTLWNVNSTAAGGGVAEMLRTLMAYILGAGAEARWVTVSGDPEFFRITKRLHNMMHGEEVEGQGLSEGDRAKYEETCKRNCEELLKLIKEEDIVILHDPQTAGMVHPLKNAGAKAIWRSHIGTEHPNAQVRQAWEFLFPYAAEADARVFSRFSYVPPELRASHTGIITPSIDPFSPKNQELEPELIRDILCRVGLVEAPHSPGVVRIPCHDGTEVVIKRRCEIIRYGPAPTLEDSVVVQVSRWDRLKDPKGVMLGFAEHLANGRNAHLILAGPSVHSVADDPEGAETLAETVALWRTLPDSKRSRIHLASLPMEDLDENAIIVNALQRHASVVVQKSLREGFGLTVTEAMWKRRPIVACNLGGVSKQIENGVSGLLIQDPRDLIAFGAALQRLLQDTAFAEQLGNQAYQRVRKHFLHSTHLAMWVDLIASL